MRRPDSAPSALLKRLTKILLAAAVGLITSCSTSPEGRKQLIALPDATVDNMGKQSFEEMKGQTPISHDPKVNAYIRCIAEPISRIADSESHSRTWDIVVFQDDKTINAFALPGGEIGVYTGILPVTKTPAQLAAVIGHEVGHVLARHGNERITSSLLAQGGMEILDLALGNPASTQHKILLAALGAGVQGGYLLPHSRKQESEADIIGLKLMAQAGFRPEEAVDLWKNMAQSGGAKPPEILSDHPSDEKRISNIESHLPEADALYAKASVHPNCVR